MNSCTALVVGFQGVDSPSAAWALVELPSPACRCTSDMASIRVGRISFVMENVAFYFCLHGTFHRIWPQYENVGISFFVEYVDGCFGLDGAHHLLLKQFFGTDNVHYSQRTIQPEFSF